MSSGQCTISLGSKSNLVKFLFFAKHVIPVISFIFIEL